MKNTQATNDTKNAPAKSTWRCSEAPTINLDRVRDDVKYFHSIVVIILL